MRQGDTEKTMRASRASPTARAVSAAGRLAEMQQQLVPVFRQYNICKATVLREGRVIYESE